MTVRPQQPSSRVQEVGHHLLVFVTVLTGQSVPIVYSRTLNRTMGRLGLADR